MAVDYTTTQSRARRRARRVEVEASSLVRRVDWVLLTAVAAIVAYGLWAIAGITQHDVTGNPNYYVVRQVSFVAVGLVALVVAALIDPAVYHRYSRLLYAAAVGLVAFVFLAGPVTRGSRRWLDLGPFRFQPSEFGKLLLVLFLAAFLADRYKRVAAGDVRVTLLCDRARARADRPRLPAARLRHRPRLRRGARSPCCSSPAPAGSSSRRSARWC